MANVGVTKMSLIYDETHIRTGVVAQDKNELFKYLSETLARIDDLDEGVLMQGLRDREAMMSTLIAPGIALPHARLRDFGRSTGLLTILPAGCRYGDDGTVRIALMIVDDDEDASGHLGILRQFALLARNPRFSEKLLAAPDGIEIKKLIDRFEKTM